MKSCVIYTTVRPTEGQNIITIGFAPVSEKDIKICWTFASGFTSEVLIERTAFSAMLRELNRDCLKLGQTDFDDPYSEFEALRLDNRRLRVRVDELIYELASLKEKE